MAHRIRIGCIGAGRYTRRVIIPSFVDAPEFELAIVSNRSEQTAARAASEFDVPRWTTRWRDVIDDRSIDAVMIGTPPRPHAEIAIAALQAGKHVLCQTRMAANLEDARAMAEAARASGARAMLVPPDSYVRGRRYISHLVANGALGPIRQVLCYRYLPTVIDSKADLLPRQDVRMFGVINPLHLGLCWDSLELWFGPAVKVLAHAQIFTPLRRDPSTGELGDVGLADAITATAEMASGATVVNAQSGVAIAGDDKIVIHGEDATVVYEASGERLLRAGRGNTGLAPLEIPAKFEYRQQIAQEFASLLSTGIQPNGSTFDDGLRNIAYLTACHRSATEGRWVGITEILGS
jgi:predicted dehydrogenase